MNQALLDFCPLFWGPQPHMHFIGYLIVSYLIASIPFGVIFSQLLGTVDIRKHGSKNIGATNAFRTGGKKIGVLTLLFDFLKGFLPVYFLTFFITILPTQEDMFFVLTSLICVLGHVYSFWLRGKGGKGVATALGTLFFINPTLFGICILIWGITFFVSENAGASSVTVFLLLPIIVFLNPDFSLWMKLYSCILCVLIIWTHRSNILNLWSLKKNKP